jgi:hypothetical protein
MSLLSTMALPLRRLQGAKDMPRAPSLPRPRPRLPRHGGWISHHVSLDYGRRGGRAHGEIRRRLQPQRVCLCRSLLTWPLPFWTGMVAAIAVADCERSHAQWCVFFWGDKKKSNCTRRQKKYIIHKARYMACENVVYTMHICQEFRVAYTSRHLLQIQSR